MTCVILLVHGVLFPKNCYHRHKLPHAVIYIGNHHERKETRTMKNRKIIVTAFLLIACMVIGVGYAAVTDNFTINGHATISDQGANDAFNEDIRFMGIVVNGEVRTDVLASANLGYTASCNMPLDEASFHVNDLKKVGDTKTIVFRVGNYGEIDSTLKLDTTNPDGTNTVSVPGTDPAPASPFKVTYSLADGTSLPAAVDADTPSYVDITVTITVETAVVEETTADFVFKFTANNAA